MKVDPPSAQARVLASLTHLMASWSSTATQAAIAEAANVAIDPIDISPLYMLGLRGPISPSELATALHLTRPTMSKQLARLTRAGLIERTAQPGDRRASTIRLAPTGAVAYQRLVARGVTMLQLATSDWADGEADFFAAQLSRFVDALGAQTIPTGRKPASGPQ